MTMITWKKKKMRPCSFYYRSAAGVVCLLLLLSSKNAQAQLRPVGPPPGTGEPGTTAAPGPATGAPGTPPPGTAPPGTTTPGTAAPGTGAPDPATAAPGTVAPDPATAAPGTVAPDPATAAPGPAPAAETTIPAATAAPEVTTAAPEVSTAAPEATAAAATTVPPGPAPPAEPETDTTTSEESSCYSDLDTINNELSAIGYDLTAYKRFVLCPETTFEIGNLEVGVGIVEGQSPIVPRSNTEFSCGEDGSSTNNCILKGGDYGFLAFGSLFFDDLVAVNVTVRGLTFDNQISSGVSIQQAGDFQFVDCIFQNSAASAPVLINFERSTVPVASAEPLPTNSRTHFSECIFQNNTQRAGEVGVEFGVMTIKGDGNVVEVDDCIFRNNRYADSTIAQVGYAISLGDGNTMEMKSTCLLENSFLGAGPVTINPNTFFILINDYDDSSDGLVTCQYAARFPDEAALTAGTPQCIPRQVQECKASIL